MAVSLDYETPSRSTFFYLDEPLEYKFTLDDIGTSPEVRKLVYQVFAEDENSNEIPLTEKKYIRPINTSQIIHFTINDLVKSSFSSDVPLLDGNSSPQDWQGSMRRAFVKYGELIINTDTEVVTGDATISTTKHKVVDAYEQSFTSTTKMATSVLTECSHVRINDNSHDWVSVFSASGGSVNLTITEEDNTETVKSVSISAGVTLVPVGGANIESGAISAKDIKKVEIQGKTISYNHSYKSESNRLDIYFQDPKGSWRVMNFDKQGFEEVSRDFVSLCRNNGVSQSISDLVKNHGYGLLNKRTWLEFSAVKMAFVRSHNKDYYRAFANARQYRAAIKDSNNNTILFPLIPKVSSIPVWSQSGMTEIEFSGSIGVDLRVGSI